MRSYRSIIVTACAAVALAALPAGYFAPLEAAGIAVSELRQKTHIHGLAVDRTDSSQLLIATHHGLFRATTVRFTPVEGREGIVVGPWSAVPVGRGGGRGAAGA